MRKKYYFVRHSGGLSVGVTIYHVWVGSSEREQTKLALVQAYCKENDLPMVRWSHEVDSLIDSFQEKHKADDCALAKPYRTASVSISVLFQMILDDSFAKFEAYNYASHFEIYLNHRNDPNFMARENRHSCITPCQPHHAENLSVRDSTRASI